MKILDYYRHAQKDGNNLTKEGFAAAIKFGTHSQGYDYAVGGNESRTWQTLCAFVIENLSSPKLLTPVANFGDSSLFESWMDRGFGEAVKKTGSNIAGIHEILPKNEFQEACAYAMAGVVEVFQQMEDNTACIGFGHSPIIELAAIGAGMGIENIPNLKELEGLRFEQQDDGLITVIILLQ